MSHPARAASVATALLLLVVPPVTARATAPVSAARAAAPVSAARVAAPVAAGSVTFGIQAATGHRSDARSQFQFGGGPGSAAFHDSVSVLNIGTVPLHLALYPADSQGTTNGGFAVKLQHSKQDDVGSWIRLSSGPTLTVPARTATGISRVFVPFSLAIPRTATPGDHVGAIMVSLSSSGGSSAQANENLDQRVGIRVYVRVSGTVRARLAVQQLDTSYGPQWQADPIGTGRVSVSYTVRNTGNVILGARQRVSVSGLLGGSGHATLPLIPALIPGDSVRVHTVVAGVFPQLSERTTVTLQPLAPVGASDAGLIPVSASSSTWAVPWLLIVIVVVLAAALVWYLRRRRASSGAHSAARSKVTAGASR